MSTTIASIIDELITIAICLILTVHAYRISRKEFLDPNIARLANFGKWAALLAILISCIMIVAKLNHWE